MERADLDSIINALVQNQQKINQHGRRADSIVKSMLQHSRVSSGQKELTDINEICDEYVRLTFHGYKAKDRTFSAAIEKDFAEGLPKINIVTQDIGRVILNLVNNAFYEVTEKSKMDGVGYSPTVKVSTKKLPGKIEIRVSDNGRGMTRPFSPTARVAVEFVSIPPTHCPLVISLLPIC